MKGLTKRERVLFDLLKKRRSRGVTSRELLDALHAGKTNLPYTEQHAMTVSLKYLSSKVCQQGWIIRKVNGGLGRGNIATYEMTKYKLVEA